LLLLRRLWWRQLLRRPELKSRRSGPRGLVALVRSTPLCVEREGGWEMNCRIIRKPRPSPKSTPSHTFSCRQTPARKAPPHLIPPIHTHTQWPHEEQSSLAPAGEALLPYVARNPTSEQRLTSLRCLRVGWPPSRYLHPPPMLLLPPLHSRSAMPLFHPPLLSPH
jgi:hypothetical protein